MMREIKQETTILFSTHVLHDAQEISDDILIINNGEIAISGELGTVMAQYQKPIIQIEFDSDSSELLKSIESYSFVSEVKIQGNLASIGVTDMEKGRQTLLQQIVNQGVPIRKFELAQTTLEDLFMEVVNA